MTDELDTLRPEVRKIINREDACIKSGDTLVTISRKSWEVIRAELARLADAHATQKAQSIHPRAQLLIMLGHANDRAEKAEAELAALKARIAEALIAQVRRILMWTEE